MDPLFGPHSHDDLPGIYHEGDSIPFELPPEDFAWEELEHPAPVKEETKSKLSSFLSRTLKIAVGVPLGAGLVAIGIPLAFVTVPLTAMAGFTAGSALAGIVLITKSSDIINIPPAAMPFIGGIAGGGLGLLPIITGFGLVIRSCGGKVSHN